MSSNLQQWQRAFNKTPLVAILRGVTPDEIIDVGTVLIDAGFTLIEIPLNSPNAFESIKKLANYVDDNVMVGAGTVLTEAQVTATSEAGGKLIIAPNLNISVANAAMKQQLVYCPGIATPSEAFAALEAGAHALKLFPAEMITPAVVKAMRAVLPPDTLLLPVGGITPDATAQYREAGANGFGLGSVLYKPGKSLSLIKESAFRFTKPD